MQTEQRPADQNAKTLNERVDEIRKRDSFEAQEMKYKMRIDCETMKKVFLQNLTQIMTDRNSDGIT